MYRLAALVVALVPIAAAADPAMIGPRLSPAAKPLQQAYYAPLAVAPGGAPKNGWGLRASLDGRWIDLRAHNLDWADDPAIPARDVQAGLEWRHGAAAAVLGYGQFDTGVDKDPAQWDRLIPQASAQPGDPGVLGLNLVLRSR